MLSIPAIKAAILLATKAAEQNLQFQTVAATPLSKLCQATSPNGNHLVSSENYSDETNPEQITDSTISDYASLSDNLIHTQELSALTHQVSTAVSSHLHFARNTVLANVKEYTDAVLKDSSSFIVNPINDFEICSVGLPELLSYQSLLSQLETDASNEVYAPEKYPKYASKSSEELLALISSGNDSLDKLIAKWYSAKDKDFLYRIWEEYFTASMSDVPYIKALTDINTGLDTSLAIYLLAHAARNKLNEAAGLHLKQLEETLEDYLKTSACSLLSFINKQKRMSQSETLVLQYDKYRKKVTVNKPVYLKWVNNGGRNELILGSLVSGSNLITISQFEEKAEYLLTHWDRYVAASTARYKNELYALYTTSLRTHFFDLLKTVLDPEKEMFAKPNHLDKINELFESELETLTIADLDHIEPFCLRLMCKARYYYTDSYAILNNISCHTENPEISVKQAALLSTIDYITDYVASQISSNNGLR